MHIESHRLTKWKMPLLLLFIVSANLTYGIASEKVKQPLLDAKTRLKNHRQFLKMRETSIFKDLKWRSIGPQVMSGRVTDIAVPHGIPYTFYVATASGGVWKTENEGTTWKAIFDDAPSGSTGAIACAPSQPNTVWVGLGEANIFRSSMSGTGVYKSTDAGKTWQHMGLADSQHIARIVIHPTNPNVVYIAAAGHEWNWNEQRGIFKTTDGGKTWKKVLYENEKVGAIDLAMDPSNSEILYASMWDRTRLKWSDPKPGPGGGIFKSTDGGENWKKLSQGLPKQSETGRMGIAIARSNPKVVYLLMDNHEKVPVKRKGQRDSYGRVRTHIIKGAQVYRSHNGGESFTKVSSGRNLRRVFSTYGWVFGQIRVDPNDENTTYVMGVPLMRSTDGGKTYVSIRYAGLHGDHHAMWIDPNRSNHIINGNDGGLNISYDFGKTWKNIENLPVVQFYNVAYDWAKPFNVYGSIQDNNSWKGPVTFRPGFSRSSSRWVRCPGGEASYHAVDPNDPNILYSESFYGRIQRSTLKPRRTKSIVPKSEKGEPRLRGQWLAPFLVSPHNSKVLYHGMQFVFRTEDRGNTWKKISPDLSHNDPKAKGDIPYQTVTTISESPLKAGVVYAGTDDGRLHMTKNTGGTWSEILNGIPKDKWISRVVASQYDVATVYLSQNGKRDCDFAAYLFKSTDYGQTWTDIAANIPGGPINVVKEDPKNKNILYVGTDLGVYVTINGGKEWHVLGSGLPITFVHDLVIHPRDDVCVIATHGRGMFSFDVKRFRRKLEDMTQTQR